ncbi:MAG: cytochrome c [Gemmatimonadota bacterium]|nr:cytochrome c [Gemmatimonadota bacterium]
MWLSACNGPDAGSGGPGSGGEFGAASADRGRTSFLRHCAICHGSQGDGRGPRAGSVSGTPRDFTNPVWREGKTSEDIFGVISNGLTGTAMPAWAASLSSSERWDLVAYVLDVARE